MQQAQATQYGGDPNPLDEMGLCLLSLDGGGIRGLSTLYILKKLMLKLAHERYGDAANTHPPVKPCEVFDLIGGTSTGGLIAIMLGRLEMTVDGCISAYRELIKDIFKAKDSRFGVGATGSIKAQFSSKTLETAIKRMLASCDGVSEDDLLDDGKARGCKVFVCATAHETKGISRLRSYSLPGELGNQAPPTICEAALATSAATRFFDPVKIGARTFVDGALGANNPADEVEVEAAKIWCPDTAELKPLVKCFISIGTGDPGKTPIKDKVWKFLAKTLVELATETEQTANKFAARWKGHLFAKRYFRFNVQQGLQGVGLAEYQKEGAIEAATVEFLDEAEQYFRVQDCARNLKQKQNKTQTGFVSLINEYRANEIIASRSITDEPRWLVPFSQNPKFVGREAQLDKLQKCLFVDGCCPKVALVGLGGVGKTQIAIEFANRARAKYPECSVFWVPATNIESIEQAYRQIGQQLRIPGLEEKQANVKELVRQRLNQKIAGPWLLIFDNSDDADMWVLGSDSTTESRCLRDYLPDSNLGCILFTTRSRKTAFELAGHSLVEVTEMDEQAATRLLQRSLPNREIPSNDPAMLQLLKQLTCLPLAIMQAAAYMDKNAVSFSEYLALLQEKEEDVVKVLSEDFQEEGRYHNIKNPVATTWLISFEQIRRHDPLAADYLSFMSCLDPKDIPQSLLPPARSRKQMVDVIGTLSGYSFVAKRTDEALDIHRLVHIATRNWLRVDGRLGEWTTRVAVRLSEVFPSNDHNNRSIWRLYLPHTRYLFESRIFSSDDEDRLGLLEKVGRCLLSDGRYSEAERAFEPVMETRKEELGEKHPDTLVSMNDLASTYWKQGRWEEAEQLFVQVMETRKEELGEKHLDTLTNMANLALTYRKQGRWREAEQLFVQVMETRKEELGEKHPDTLMNMNNLALTYLDQGRWKEAEQLFMQVMETLKEELGKKHPDTLVSMNNLASTYQSQGRWKEAEQLNVQVIEIRKEELGEKHPDTLMSMNNLASTYSDQGRWKEAEQLFVQVMETRKEELGEKHPDTLTSMANLAFTWKSQDRKNDAILLIKQCSRLYQQVLGSQHPDTISSLSTLKVWQIEKFWRDVVLSQGFAAVCVGSLTAAVIYCLLRRFC